MLDTQAKNWSYALTWASHRPPACLERRFIELTLHLGMLAPVPAILFAIFGNFALCLLALVLVFLPSAMLAARRALHRRGLLRCDWLVDEAGPKDQDGTKA
jgi:hypothetical protein